MTRYGYTDEVGWRLFIEESGSDDDAAMVMTHDENGRGVSLNLPKGERRIAAQYLAGSEWRVVPKWTERENDRLKRENDDLHKQLHDAEVQAAQPDRPEPVDPASVRKGDYVSIESINGTQGRPGWRIDGTVSLVYEDGLITISILGSQMGIDPTMSTVRVLHRPEPEPDSAAVEALAQMMREANGTERAKAEWDRSPQLVPVAAYAEYLVRRGVTVPEADRDE